MRGNASTLRADHYTARQSENTKLIWIKMNQEDIDRAARLWNRGYDTVAIAEILFGNKGKEPDVYRLLASAIRVRAQELREASNAVPARSER